MKIWVRPLLSFLCLVVLPFIGATGRIQSLLAKLSTMLVCLDIACFWFTVWDGDLAGVLSQYHVNIGWVTDLGNKNASLACFSLLFIWKHSTVWFL